MIQRHFRLTVNLRPGTSTDIPELNAIALDAKAHWGYSPEQIEAWCAELLVCETSLADSPLCVAEHDSRVVGFVQVSMTSEPWEVMAMWVRPESMGKGVGRALLGWATQLAAAHGEEELIIDSDPHAKGFYEACGAWVVGRVAAPIEGEPHRCRFLLRLPTSAS